MKENVSDIGERSDDDDDDDYNNSNDQDNANDDDENSVLIRYLTFPKFSMR